MNVIDIRAAKIRKMNDALRHTLANSALGRVVVTPGIMEMDSLTKAKVFEEIRRFDRFTEDNDPFGEHDFGAVQVKGRDGADHRALFKIDYYDKSLTYGSEDPSDEAVTTRVLTIMTSAEW